MEAARPEDPAVAEAAPARPGRRYRAAVRGNRLVVIAIVVAVAAPLFLSYAGFDPTPKSAARYPKLQIYLGVRTPEQGLDHGLDFSQVWLSARRVSAGAPIYYPVDFLTWRREWSSTYHPLIHWLYTPLGQLPFKAALITHNILGIALLLVCGGLAMRSAGCLEAFPSAAAATLAAMVLTPVGLLHLERGQMDLYVAASMLCLLAFFSQGRVGWAIAAGILSTLKVQAWIFVGLYWCLATSLWGMRDRRIWWVPGSILALTGIFVLQVMDWIPSFLYVARNSSTHGPSFTRILPDAIVFALPLASTLAVALACLRSLRERGERGDAVARRALLHRVSLPVAAALALQTICGTPVTHDYRLVALLGLLPALSIWCIRVEGVPDWMRSAMSSSYALLVIVAFRVNPFTPLPFPGMAWVLLLFSLLYLAAALYLATRPAIELGQQRELRA
jgi:hypothetical protein